MIHLEQVLKISLQDVLKTSWRCLEDVLKMFWKRLSKKSWRRLEDVLKTSWKRLKDVLKTYDQEEYVGLDQDVLKTFWRRILKTKMEDVFKTSSRRLHQDECLLGHLLWACSSLASLNKIIKIASLKIRFICFCSKSSSTAFIDTRTV